MTGPMPVLPGVDLRGLVVPLEPGEWYHGWMPLHVDLAGAAIRIQRAATHRPRVLDGMPLVHVDAHRIDCQHPIDPALWGCEDGYVALAAIERALAKRGVR